MPDQIKQLAEHIISQQDLIFYKDTENIEDLGMQSKTDKGKKNSGKITLIRVKIPEIK